MAALQPKSDEDIESIDSGVLELGFMDRASEALVEGDSLRDAHPSLDPLVADSGDDTDISELVLGQRMVIVEDLCKQLPQDILDMILKRLPPAAYCRSRSVCKHWRQLLSSLPDWTQARGPFTIATTHGSCDTLLFCPAEENFFTFPFSKGLSKEMDLHLHLRTPNYILPHPIHWHLVDVDGGLLCYKAFVDGEMELCVCNPLTNRVRLISPYFLDDESQVKVKLLVDNVRKTFKVIMLVEEDMTTALYDSASSSWDILENFPYWTNEWFKWRNVVYAYRRNGDHLREVVFEAFDMNSRQWETILAEFPREDSSMNVYIVSDQKQVLLVHSYFEGGQRFSVWKLKGDGSRQASSFSTWENLSVDQESAVLQMAERREWLDVCCGAGYLCFSSRGSPEAVVYSLATKKFSSMPRWGGWTTIQQLYPWEPGLMDVGVHEEKEHEEEE